MAYTTTSKSTAATLVGTSGNDSATAPTSATKTIQVNGYAGNDSITLGTAIGTSGTIGMGSGTDTVTVSSGIAIKKVNITLGDSADTYTTGGADNGVTVGGQDGADTFNINAAVVSSRYAGGKGADTFVSTTANSKNTTVVGGSEADVIGTSSERFDTGTSDFINGQVGKDSIFLTALAKTTVHGGSEDDTINNDQDADGLYLSGDKGADTIVDGAGDNSLLGGGGADTITAGGGTDTITAGLGADTIVYTTVSATAFDIVTDFDVDFDKASMDISALNAAYTVSSAASKLTTGNDVDVAAGDTAVIQNIGQAATIAKKTNVINWTKAAENAAALESAVEAVTINTTAAVDAGDMFVFQYNTAGGTQKLALGRVASVSSTTVSGWDFEDLSSNGAIADLASANYTFVA